MKDIDWTRLNTGNVLWSLRWQKCYLELGYTREYFMFALGFLGYSFAEYVRDNEIIYEKLVAHEPLISEAAHLAGIKRWPVDPGHMVFERTISEEQEINTAKTKTK